MEVSTPSWPRRREAAALAWPKRHPLNAGDFRAQFGTQRRLANIFGWCGVVRFWDACFKMETPNKNPANRAGLSREVGSAPPSMRRADSILSKQCSRAEAGYVLQWPVISSQGTRRMLTAFLQAKASPGQRSVECVPLMPQLFSVFSHAVSEPRSDGEKRACQPALALAWPYAPQLAPHPARLLDVGRWESQ